MQEIFPTRLMVATGRLYSERASLVRRSKRSSFPLFNSPKSVEAIAGDAARRDEVRLISLSHLSLAQNSAGFRRETRRFILRGKNSRQVPHELKQISSASSTGAPRRLAPWRWRNAINGIPARQRGQIRRG